MMQVLPRCRWSILDAATLLCVALVGAAATDAPAQTGDVRRVHDPSIIQSGGEYVIFSTDGGIRMRRSRDLYRWHYVGDVFDRLPPWIAEEVPGVRGLWAPDISYFNGRYHLYYSASRFGTNRSCIGLATNKTLDTDSDDYQWIDRGMVVRSDPNRDDFNAIDPHVARDTTGDVYLLFGSYWSGIKMCRLDASTGKPAGSKDEWLSLAARPVHKAIEAPYVVQHGEHFYLFVSFDQCCRGSRSTYRMMVGRSRQLQGPYLDRSGKPMLAGGGTELLAGGGSVRGPGHNSVLVQGDRTWLVHHFYDAAERGMRKLQIRPLTWDEAGWPVAAPPIEGPADRQ
ncbi:MAG: arabinan endo-1,5-alpha-L-arabinosidase [Planctomycetes bacterium]|nr:arabinan endo-1,5-alpha-L-arabinosidase [Planctomycetota bacterium]